MAAAGILNLFESKIAILDPPSPKNLTLEPNMKWIGSPVAEIWPFAYVGGIWNPHFWGKGMS